MNVFNLLVYLFYRLSRLLIMNFIHQPIPWYVGGPLIGLTVPLLLILGNKQFGISSTLHDLCAVCIPSLGKSLNSNIKQNIWNLFCFRDINWRRCQCYFFRKPKSCCDITGNY